MVAAAGRGERRTGSTWLSINGGRGGGGGGLTDDARGGLFADPKVTILRKYVRLFCARVNAVRRW